MGIGDEQFISLTTFRRSGAPVATPVWVVPVEDGRIGFWTTMGTGKTLRLERDPRVTVQPCGRRGTVREGSERSAGTAEMVQSGSRFEEVHAKVRAKYGFETRIVSLVARLSPQGRRGMTYADTVVLIRLDEPADASADQPKMS